MERRRFVRLTSLALLAAGGFSCRQRSGMKPRPNILFCVADDISYPHMGAYGCSWVRTPAFDRVAREGILFNHAFTPNAKCAPSRSSILTGRNSWQLEQAANHIPFFPEKFKTYAEVLGENGYHVGFTGKGWAPGVAGERDGVPRQLAGTPYQSARTTPPARHISDIDYAENFGLFLQDRPPGAPFCFWYGGFEPHRAYEYGAGVKKGGRNPAEIDRIYSFWPDNDIVRTDMLDYAFEIEYFDSHLERILGMLERSGELENTLVVVTADNGMPFPRIKGQEYECSNHMPLAVMWKDGIRNPGRVADDFVSFIDFAATFLELAGLSPEDAGMRPVQGRSLSEIFRSPRSGQVIAERDHVLIGKERHDVGRPNDWGYPIRGIVTRDYLYLHNFEPSRWPAGNPETGYLNTDGSPTKTACLQARVNPGTRKYWQLSFGKRPAEELYDLADDPDCVVNLAGDQNCREKKEELRKRLFDELKRQGDPRMFGEGRVFDEYIYADERTRNFHQRYLGGEKINAGWVNESDFEPAIK